MSNEQSSDTAIRLIAAAMLHARLLSQFFYLEPDPSAIGPTPDAPEIANEWQRWAHPSHELG
jgi:hypothetical protein